MAVSASPLSVAPSAPSASGEPATERRRIAGLTLPQLIALVALVLVAQLPLLHYALRPEPPATASLPFRDDFDRAELGPHYFTVGGHWRLRDGAVISPGVKNNPLWLQATLPAEVVVEFDVKSLSNDGDIKCEIFGNGRDHASGYVVIFGGWSNSSSVIARLDEHGRDRRENRGLRVEKGRSYHFRLERRGSVLRWYSDGQLMMEYDDPAPLAGKGHDRFGFSSWDSDLVFDNLEIRPL